MNVQAELIIRAWEKALIERLNPMAGKINGKEAGAISLTLLVEVVAEHVTTSDKEAEEFIQAMAKAVQHASKEIKS